MPVKYLVFNIAVMEELHWQHLLFYFRLYRWSCWLIRIVFGVCPSDPNLKGEHKRIGRVRWPNWVTDNLRAALCHDANYKISLLLAWFVLSLFILGYKLWRFTFGVALLLLVFTGNFVKEILISVKVEFRLITYGGGKGEQETKSSLRMEE